MLEFKIPSVVQTLGENKNQTQNGIIGVPCEHGIKETSAAGELHQSDKISLHEA